MKKALGQAFCLNCLRDILDWLCWGCIRSPQ